MFLASTSRLYARETTEEEFIRYVRDNGVSAALQPALILLYRLPIKPNNIKEFFAEYLENGACTLTNISLLRAELCYLQSEEEHFQLRLKNLDRELEDMNHENNSNIKKSDVSMLRKPDEVEFPDLMTRFVEDTKKNPSNNYNPFDLATPDFQVEETSDYEEEAGEEETETNITNISITKSLECLENKDSLTQMMEDIKEFDPWGMIFKCYDSDLKYELPKSKTEGKYKKGLLFTDIKQGISKENANDNCDISIKGESNDSEDADTLVELFHAKILPNDKIDESLFLKQKPEKLNFSNLMGWGNQPYKNYKIPPKYPLYTTLPSKSNVSGKQDFNTNVCGENDRTIKKLMKFYSQVNADGTDDNFLNFVDKNVYVGEDTYTKGIQTDILQEFEEFGGEDWEWEWDSDDYSLLPGTNSMGHINSTSLSGKGDTGNILLNEDKKDYHLAEGENYANEVEMPLKVNFPPKEKQSVLSDLLPMQQTNETALKMLSSGSEQPSQQCISPNGSPKKGKQSDKKQKGEYTKLYTAGSPKSLYAKPNAYSQQANRKSAKLLKYMTDTYDPDTAYKLQREFDFRIFDD